MEFEEIINSLPLSVRNEAVVKNDTLEIRELKLYKISEDSYLIDGYSDYVDLPKKFLFDNDILVVSILVPFILQALDGVQRL